jgi:hypothetical protein
MNGCSAGSSLVLLTVGNLNFPALTIIRWDAVRAFEAHGCQALEAHSKRPGNRAWPCRSGLGGRARVLTKKDPAIRRSGEDDMHHHVGCVNRGRGGEPPPTPSTFCRSGLNEPPSEVQQLVCDSHTHREGLRIPFGRPPISICRCS